MAFPDYSGIFKPDSGFDPYKSFQDQFGVDPYSTDASKIDLGSSSSEKSSPSFGDKFGQGMRMAGDALEKWGKNRDNDFGYYGNRGGGLSGGGVQSSGDFTVVYPQQQQPYTIQGSKSPWGALGTAVGALAAPFTGGASLAFGPIAGMFG